MMNSPTYNVDANKWFWKDRYGQSVLCGTLNEWYSYTHDELDYVYQQSLHTLFWLRKVDTSCYIPCPCVRQEAKL